jgi:hypothetical protein
MKPFPGASRAALASALLTLAPAFASAETTTQVAPPIPSAQPAPAPAAEVPATQPGQESPTEKADALVVSEPVPEKRPTLALGDETYFIKPILAIAGGVLGESLLQSPNPNRESRLTTVAIGRFGLEGRLGKFVSFRGEFERNLRAHGSGVWEGTASFSSRDLLVRLANWGASLEAGIILDPASVDYFSAHIGDLLMADKYTRDPLLFSGFNRGQGVQAHYSFSGFSVGVSYTEANPLSTSASFMVGGTFLGGTRLWEKPLANFRVGQPDDDFHFRVIAPSIMYEHPLFEVKATTQFFNINYQASQKTDPNLNGLNGRISARLKLQGTAPVPFQVTPFVNVSRIQNEVLNNTAGMTNELLQTPYQAMTFSGGVDLTVFGRSGIGINYAQVRDGTPYYMPASAAGPAREAITNTILAYLNVGGTYWVTDDVAIGARVATFSRKTQGHAPEKDMSYLMTLRLTL